MKYPIRHKFSAKLTVTDGIKFPSKKEANHYIDNKLRVKSGELVFFLRQVSLHLPGGSRHVIDFLEFNSDGTVHFVEIKGYDTPVSKLKI